jgi:DNA polymerase III delta prime subunit
LTIFSNKEKDDIRSIVIRCILFRFTDSEILEEIQTKYPDKIISQTTLSRIKRQVKGEYLTHYKNIRKTRELFVYLVMEKYNAVDSVIKEYRKMYMKEDVSDLMKFKILEKIVALDQYQLSLLQDLPYLGVYHKDSMQQLKELDKELKALNHQVVESENKQRDLSFKCENEMGQNSIDNIDPEILQVLKSRTESGLERHIEKTK